MALLRARRPDRRRGEARILSPTIFPPLGLGNGLAAPILSRPPPREYEGERDCHKVQPKWDMRGAAILFTQKP
jgi:hypothetical protein